MRARSIRLRRLAWRVAEFLVSMGAYWALDLLGSHFRLNSRGILFIRIGMLLIFVAIIVAAVRALVWPRSLGVRCANCGFDLIGRLVGPCPNCKALASAAYSREVPTCLRCHYNLTGNTSGTCPECGAPVGHPGFPKGVRQSRRQSGALTTGENPSRSDEAKRA
jgi:hypothetical protein